MKIIDMFHGKVFIYNPELEKVVFVKRKVQEDFGLLVGDKLKPESIFKIVANFSLNGQEKDQVRLYNNVSSSLSPPIKTKLAGETEELNEDSLISYLQVLEV